MPQDQSSLRSALRNQPALSKYADVASDETLEAAAFVGGHQPEHQDIAAVVLPVAARRQLEEYGLLERSDTGRRIVWRLTSTGRELASVLAAAVPPPTAQEQLAAANRLAELVAEGEEALG